MSGQALSSAGLGRQSYLTISNVAGSLEDLEVNVEGMFIFLLLLLFLYNCILIRVCRMYTSQFKIFTSCYCTNITNFTKTLYSVFNILLYFVSI